MMDDVGYGDLIESVVYVDGRISKAKVIGVAAFLVFLVWNMIFIFPSFLKAGLLLFILDVTVVFFIGLFYYAVCCVIGFVVRRFIT